MKKRKYAKIKVTVNGETVRRSIAYYTLDEYIRKRDAILADAEAAQNPTFARAAEEWLEDYEATHKEITAYTMRSHLQGVLEDYGDIKISAITPRMVQDYLEDLARKQYAYKTILSRLSVMHMVFRRELRYGRLTADPTDGLSVPKTAPRRTRGLPADIDIDQIRKHATDGKIGLLLALVMYTGLRRGEALALRYEDIDRSKKIIRVHSHVVDVGGTASEEDGAKSPAGVRAVPLLDPLAALLPNRKRGLLFPGEDGGIMSPTEYARLYRQYKAATGVTCTAHQLRHYFCTIAYDAGVEPRDLMEIMGHSSINITMDIYTKIRASRQEATASRLNAFLSVDSFVDRNNKKQQDKAIYVNRQNIQIKQKNH